jgi:hypothetical protein
MLFLAVLEPFGHPQMDPKRYSKVKGLQLGGMYSSMSKLRNRPLTKSLGPLFCPKWSKWCPKQPENKFLMLFMAIMELFWAPKEIHTGPHTNRMFGPMSELKNKPQTKSLDPFF